MADRRVLRLKLDKLAGDIEHYVSPVRGRCGHRTYVIWRASGECYACWIAQMRRNRAALAAVSGGVSPSASSPDG